jgi:hypothetical protein
MIKIAFIYTFSNSLFNEYRNIEGSGFDSRWGHRIFQLTNPSKPHYGPGVDPASNRNEYQESSWWSKGRPARKANNLTAIYEPIVQKMWEPRRLTILWASTASHRDSFIFIYLHKFDPVSN